ncbi:hypothetical protein AURDEDRAFT_154450 [Auricularia subglabra TFB-10046 SS5]|uniref:Uncharacterized protein n=1 Tax=Auricularia subglabra (strain TFB-10046 / SS5) TaxID=717982 RepID=J0DAC9_AURST|nr:hypothetical protein AURDEDRAFT_154450 [Auricularia subglabra TFB-10046 SS5]
MVPEVTDVHHARLGESSTAAFERLVPHLSFAHVPILAHFAPGEMPAPSLVRVYLTFVAYLALCSADTVQVDLNNPTLKRTANWGEQIDRSEHAGASLSFEFTGVALEVNLGRYYTYGVVNLTLDQTSERMDTYRPPDEHVSTFCALCKSGLAPMKHSVVLALIGPGQGRTPSGQAWIRIASISYETAPQDTIPSDPTSSDPAPSPSPSAVSDPSSSAVVPGGPGQTPSSHLPSPSSPTPSPSNPTSIPNPDSPTAHPGAITPTTASHEPAATPPLVPSAATSTRPSVGIIAGASASAALVVIALALAAVWVRKRRRHRVMSQPSDAAKRSTAVSSTDALTTTESHDVLNITTRRNIKPIRRDGTATGSSSMGMGATSAPDSGTEELRAEIAELRNLVSQLAAPPPLYS